MFLLTVFSVVGVNNDLVLSCTPAKVAPGGTVNCDLKFTNPQSFTSLIAGVDIPSVFENTITLSALPSGLTVDFTKGSDYDSLNKILTISDDKAVGLPTITSLGTLAFKATANANSNVPVTIVLTVKDASDSPDFGDIPLSSKTVTSNQITIGALAPVCDNDKTCDVGEDAVSCPGDCPLEICNNNKKEGTEICDGTDLNQKTCVTEQKSGGTLKCNADCKSFDVSGCYLVGDGKCDAVLGETVQNSAVDCKVVDAVCSKQNPEKCLLQLDCFKEGNGWLMDKKICVATCPQGTELDSNDGDCLPINLCKNFVASELSAKCSATVTNTCKTTCDPATGKSINCIPDCSGVAPGGAVGTAGAQLDQKLTDAKLPTDPTKLKQSDWTTELISSLANFFKGLFKL